jgi:hypothetical protein
MGTALDTVNRFLELSAPNGRAIDGLLDDMTGVLHPSYTFVGPLMRIEGREAGIELLRNFLPAHVGSSIRQQFESSNQVCSINDLALRTPGGATLTIQMAEWFQLKDGLIARHEIFYDPREFSTAFGM